MTELAIADVARADQLAAAIFAGDDPRIKALIAEARATEGSLERVALAIGVHLASIASQFYDSDAQRILDMRAQASMKLAAEAEELE